MRKKLMVFVFLLAICAPVLVVAQEAVNAEAAKLNALFETEWEWGLKQFPPMATFMGDYRWNDQLGSFGLESIRQMQQHDLEVLE
jgi:hypothetical protein